MSCTFLYHRLAGFLYVLPLPLLPLLVWLCLIPLAGTRRLRNGWRCWSAVFGGWVGTRLHAVCPTWSPSFFHVFHAFHLCSMWKDVSCIQISALSFDKSIIYRSIAVSCLCFEAPCFKRNVCHTRYSYDASSSLNGNYTLYLVQRNNWTTSHTFLVNPQWLIAVDINHVDGFECNGRWKLEWCLNWVNQRHQGLLSAVSDTVLVLWRGWNMVKLVLLLFSLQVF